MDDIVPQTIEEMRQGVAVWAQSVIDLVNSGATVERIVKEATEVASRAASLLSY